MDELDIWKDVNKEQGAMKSQLDKVVGEVIENKLKINGSWKKHQIKLMEERVNLK